MLAARELRYRVMLRAAAIAALCFLATAQSGLSRIVLIDINSATISELKTLPGIQDAWAEAIVKNRPYKNKTQLLTRKVLPFTAYRAIRDKIIAKQ